MTKLTKNESNRPKIVKKITKNGLKLVVKTGPKKRSEIGEIGQKLIKLLKNQPTMDQTDQNWSKMGPNEKIPQNW